MRLARVSTALVCGFWIISVLTGCGGDDKPATPPVVASVVLYPTTTTTIGVAGSQDFLAYALDSSGNGIAAVNFTWSSSDPGVATVSDGKASAVAVGSTNITASAQGVVSKAVALTVVQGTSVSGTAAQGAPIANAAVALKDGKGGIQTATTDASGHFLIDTTGLTPPFMLRVKAGTSLDLYSVSADANANSVINITPLTDLVIRSWFAVQDSGVDSAFTFPASATLPSPQSVEMVSKLVLPIVRSSLLAEEMDPATFNLISTPFNADHTGLDAVLDRLIVDNTRKSVTLTDGATTQKSTLAYSSKPATLSVQTDISAPKGSSSTLASSVVPIQAAEQSVVDGVNAAVAALAKAANSASTTLTGATLEPFFAQDFRDGGLPASDVAENLADEARSLDLSFRLRAVDSISTDRTLVTATFDRTLTQASPSLSRTETVQYSFKKVGDNWLLYGDQRVGILELYSEMRTYQGAITSGSGPSMNARVLFLPQGAPPSYDYVHAGAVSGGGIWTRQPLEYSDSERNDFLQLFASRGPLSAPIAAGTAFTFDLAMDSQGTEAVSYQLKTKAFTSEAISVTNLAGITIADAHLGEPLQVKWTLPQSYAVQTVTLRAVFTSDSFGYSYWCTAQGPLLSATATSASLTIPASCGNYLTTQADVYVIVEGINGERSTAIYAYR